MTDAEFWGVLAEMIEGAGCLPEFDRDNGCHGLCACLLAAHRKRLVDYSQYVRLKDQLLTVAPPMANLHWQHWWPQDSLKPRIAACRALMRACLEREL